MKLIAELKHLAAERKLILAGSSKAGLLVLIHSLEVFFFWSF